MTIPLATTSAPATVATIDCQGVNYREVNGAVRDSFAGGTATVNLVNVNGHRYIGTGVQGSGLRIEVRGTPGQAAGMFMDGPTIEVYGNAQDGVGNTMNGGEVIVHGNAGDVLGYGMRGGRVFVRGDVGYRLGIHMKASGSSRPVVVCGGKARDFCGEYMAGGLLVVLGMAPGFDGPVVGNHLGAGMHGGEIYVRGHVDDWQCGDDVQVTIAGDIERARLRQMLADYCAAFEIDPDEVLDAEFTRVLPASGRPYAGLYTCM